MWLNAIHNIKGFELLSCRECGLYFTNFVATPLFMVFVILLKANGIGLKGSLFIWLFFQKCKVFTSLKFSIRIWWLIAVSLSLYGFSILVENVIDKWHRSPTIVTFEDKFTPITDIPFPALTICPSIKRFSFHDRTSFHDIRY